MNSNAPSARVYGQFCPVSMGAEVFATKWTPIILRELLCGSTRFNDLQRGMPFMSRSLLSQRLQELEHVGLVEKRRDADNRGPTYHLTEAGEALRPVVFSLGWWAHRWLQREIPEQNLDPRLLMWDVRRNIDTSCLPSNAKTVVQFMLGGLPANQRLWWLVIEKDEVDLCLKRPAPENELEVAAHIADLTNVWLGHLAMKQALADGRIRLTGAPEQCNAFKRWFLLNFFARTEEGTF